LNSNRQASRGWWARGIERERRAVLRAARPGACIGRVSALNRGDDGVVTAASAARPAAPLTQSRLCARATSADRAFKPPIRSLDYTYLDATFREEFAVISPNHPEAVDGEIEIEGGDRLPLIPKHLLKASVRFAAT
jgi:hypothetical protein